MLLPAVGLVIALQATGRAALSPMMLGLTLAGASLASFALTVAIRWRSTDAWLRERTGRARASRRRDEGGVLRAIVDASDGVVRIRGRVRSIRPVPTPGGDLVAAFRARRVEAAAGRGRREEMVETTAAGRFVVDDGTGLAVVDDDAFALEPLDVGATAEVLALRDGDLVEVIGPARRAPLPQDVHPGNAAEQETALIFDGSPDSLVLLVPLPLEASMAPPRSRAYGVATRPGPQTLEHDALHEAEAGGRAEAEAHGPITGPDR